MTKLKGRRAVLSTLKKTDVKLELHLISAIALGFWVSVILAYAENFQLALPSGTQLILSCSLFCLLALLDISNDRSQPSLIALLLMQIFMTIVVASNIASEFDLAINFASVVAVILALLLSEN